MPILSVAPLVSKVQVLNTIPKWHLFYSGAFFILNLVLLCFCQLCGINERFFIAQLSLERTRLTAEF